MVTRQTNNQANLTMGDSGILIAPYGTTKDNARDVGMTDGGVGLEVSNSYYEATTDQYVGIVRTELTDRRIQINFAMSEDTLENMALAMDLPASAVDELTNTLQIGNSAGGERSVWINGPAPAGGTAEWVFWKVAEITMSETRYTKEGEALKDVTMTVIVDTSKAKEIAFGQRQDTYSDTTAPSVSSITPTDADDTVDVSSTIAWTFDEAIQQRDITSGNFNITDDTGAEVAGELSYDEGTNTVTFTPDSNLSALTTYLTFASGEIRDMAGNQMGNNYRTSFTTT